MTGRAHLLYTIKQSDFEAIGDEAFTPPSDTTMLALAWLEEKHFDDVISAGRCASVEHVTLEAGALDNTLDTI